MINSLHVDPELPDPPTTVGPMRRHPTYRHFECADGLWISLGALGPKFETNLLRSLGLDEILIDPRIQGVTAKAALPENLPWCSELITGAFASRSRPELLDLITAVGIPCGPSELSEGLVQQGADSGNRHGYRPSAPYRGTR
ncbi:CoA transferase [Arthrobacter sp. P2b]|uniref:CoA transferase n=2 Tax=unclassified Arthrobacter TaxID=235627 RepID=UPI0015E0755B